MRLLAAVAIAALGLSEVDAQKLGLSSSFGDVTVQNMRLGTAYPIKKLKGHAYSLTNISEVPVDLVVDVVAPIQGSLRPLYEDIPDARWVKVSPSTFKLAPGASAESEVTLKVPDDAQWKDRSFQCALYAHTLQGSFVNVGIYDKIFFSTGAGPEALKGKGPRLDLLPASLRAGKVKPGAAVASSALPARLRVRNVGDAARKVAFSTVPFDEKHPAPKGWSAAGEGSSLSFPEAAVAVGGDQVADAPFQLELAKAAAGRKVAFRVRAASEDGSLEAYAVVLAEGQAPAKKAAAKAKKG